MTNEDDDAKAASKPARDTVSDEQAAQIREQLVFTRSNEAKFLELLKVPAVENIFADKFEDVMTMISDTAKRRLERENAR